MSLGITLTVTRSTTVFDTNITHNLNDMARAAGIYKELWRPEELGVETAAELIIPIREGLRKLKANPEKFTKFNADNGWGTYKQFVPFVEEYLEACENNPDATISVSR